MSKSGRAPLGHSAMSKVKLEGPKKQHENHGMDASVPGKPDHNIGTSGHWEHRYSLCDPSRAMKITEGSNFSATKASMKPTTHLKVNKEDY